MLIAFDVLALLFLALKCLALTGNMVLFMLSLANFLIERGHYGPTESCIVLCALVLDQGRILHHLAAQA